MAEEGRLKTLDRAFAVMGLKVTTNALMPGMLFLHAISTGKIAMASTGEYGWESIDALQNALLSSEFQCISYEKPPLHTFPDNLPLKNPFLSCKSLEEVEIMMDLMDVERRQDNRNGAEI